MTEHSNEPFSSPTRRPACMDEGEFERWREANRSTALRGRTHEAISPCEDCTAAFAQEMRDQGRCDGQPGTLHLPPW